MTVPQSAHCSIAGASTENTISLTHRPVRPAVVLNDIREKVPDRVEKLVHVSWEWVVVAVLARFMFVTRMKTFAEFNTDAGVWFFGTDAYYHARHTVYAVANFPSTLGYDAMTQYPLGTDPGQFGTLFDQIAAALAWLVGLIVDGGQPATSTILDVVTAYPAILGGLSVIPVYLLVRDLYGRGPGLYAAIAAALIPGSYLIRTIAGFSDHHSIEIVLSTLAVWATYRAFQAWQDLDLELASVASDPLLVYREHRRALSTSLFAALAFWAYLAAWPPGVLFVGIVGAWLVVQTLVEVTRGEDPVDLVVTGATVFGFLAVLMLPYAIGSPSGGFSALNFTWMQPAAPLLAALGLVALAVLAIFWRREDLPAPAYPVAAIGGGLLGLGVLYLVLPDLVQQTLSGASWVTGIGVDPTRRTISEAQPAEFSRLGSQFGWLYISAAGAFVLALLGTFTRPEERTNSLIVVWAILTTMGTFTQSRFLYYLAVSVLVLNGYLAYRLLQAADVFAEESQDDDVEEDPGWTGAHVTVLVALALILFPTNISGFTAPCGEDTNGWTAPDCFGGPGESKMWAQELNWVNENTAEPPLTLNDSFEPRTGERYDYPQGMYGVLSWWDYGHQILFDGERAAIANPFQQQAPLASEIFTAQNETEAVRLLEDYLGEDNEARYLMIDDAMASTKFSAITVWADVRDPYLEGQTRSYDVQGQDRTLQLQSPSDRVRDWFLQDVYHNDASGMEHFRLVKEHPQFSLIGSSASVSEDRVQVRGYNTILDRGPWDKYRDLEREGAYGAGGNNVIYDAEGLSRLKTYEHVPGATITGQADPGTEVTATLDLRATASDRPFTYEQTTQADEDGTFALTVPYSTSDDVGPQEGGTNLSVQPQGPYDVTVGNETIQLQVPEPAVLNGQTVPVGN